MCGGDLNITDLDKVVVCDYCGTTQTVPSADSEKKLTLFNRANRLRLANEFDKAAGIYENIVAEFPEEAEAYWGLCLCNYGIEYVDDPATGKKIPTCHRASFQKLREDENFELAMEYADVIAQKIYRDEAREIDRINEEILSVSRNESPYDVFICYKETDEAGERTPDSVMAQDIYDALTTKGLKVFFARISLESKLGQQYEPYIFAALNSAKIMLCVGTRYEYFHAVWVKNEWGRFLRLAAKDKSKALIPCYKDMDPYDLPDAFKGLQAQDLGKLGAIQDLVHGVEKLLVKDAAAVQTAAAPVANSTAATVESLLKRAFMFLEDGNWQSADEYAEKVLDLEPENGEAYLAKAMAETQVHTRSETSKSLSFHENQNIHKVLRYGNDQLKKELEQYLSDSREAKKKASVLMREELVKQERIKKLLSVSDRIMGIKTDGTVLLSSESRITGGDEGFSFDISDWKDIDSVYANYSYCLGLKTDGTVLITGDVQYSRDKVKEWQGIVSIAAAYHHIVGLKSDGMVIATGENKYGECNVSEWRNIIAVAAGDSYTVGLQKDGTVIATGKNDYGQCNVSEWKNIIKIAIYGCSTYGLKDDGTVLAVGRNDDGECDTDGWQNIIDIAISGRHAIGLRIDGTVVSTKFKGEERGYAGRCDTQQWHDIIAIECGSSVSFGLRRDGSVVYTLDPNPKSLTNFRLKELPSWRNIIAVSADSDAVVGIQSDGHLMVAKYRSTLDLPDLSDWKLFDNYETIEQERAVAREKARQEAERIAEQNRILAEQKRQKELMERQAAERERIAKLTALLASLQKEKATLEDELPMLKGIFKAGRRKEVEERLAIIEANLNELTKK
jgi:hypothetical protein